MALSRSERGSAFFWLFAAVALFGALGWAMLGERQQSLGVIEDEAEKTEQTRLADCGNSLTMAVKRLKMRGCPSYSFDTADSSDCAVFSPIGGGAKSCPGLNGWCVENRALLQPAQLCGGIIYIGEFQGFRLYTTAADSGQASYNHGGVPLPTDNAFIAKQDYGWLNTNDLMQTSVGGPYNAAALCRSLGPDWYLPALLELRFLLRERAKGALAGTMIEAANYWGSNFSNAAQACSGLVNSTFAVYGSCIGTPKQNVLNVRCMRR